LSLAGQIIAAVAGLVVALFDVVFLGDVLSNGPLSFDVVFWMWPVGIGAVAALLLGSLVVSARHLAWMRGLAAILSTVIGIAGFFFFGAMLIGAVLAGISAGLAVDPRHDRVI
jgi:hypothetical protein